VNGAGFDEGRTGHYARSQDGLWVRSIWEQARGLIEVSWGERIIVNDGQVLWLDENGLVSRSDDARFAKHGDSWVVAGEIQMDRPGFIEFGRGHMRIVIESIMCHVSCLAAMGFGASVSEVVGWFERPEDGHFVVASTYRVTHGVGLFEGADGMLFEVLDMENDVLSGVVHVGGHESFGLESKLEPGMLRDFLVSTEPA